MLTVFALTLRVRRQARGGCGSTLRDPSQFKQLLFQAPVALLEAAEGCGT